MKSKLTIRKCKNCKKEFQKLRPLQTDCSYTCAAARSKFKINKEFAQRCRDEKKAFNIQNKKIDVFEKEAKDQFQLWIRMRDKDLPCISCGTDYSEIWDGGHYLKAELYSGLIFNEKNCNKQCRKCNYFMNGNELMYRDGLIQRFGEDHLKELESIKNGLRQYKYTKDELIKIKQHYKLKIKQLKQ